MNNQPSARAIVTMPPHAPHVIEVLKHPIVSGIRLNTVMPVKASDDVVKRLHDVAGEQGKEFWVDLKCRQLRIANSGTPPYTEIRLSHKIEVYTPTKAYFGDRGCCGTVLEVDGDRLIMQDGPRRVVGPGESVTIPHPTLRVEGYFTDTDKKYIEAVNKLDNPLLMLSFVEGADDVAAARKLAPQAKLVAKIESVRGRDYVRHKYSGATGDDGCHLMAARGDLFMELHWPQEIIPALELIVEKDPSAIVASRIFDSFADQPEPTCSDIGDVDNLLRMGYRQFMLGDEVCLRREPVMSALNLLADMARRYT